MRFTYILLLLVFSNVFWSCESKNQVECLLSFKLGMSEKRAMRHYDMLIEKGIVEAPEYFYNNGIYTMQKYIDGINIRGVVKLDIEDERLSYITFDIRNDGFTDEERYQHKIKVSRLKSLLSEKYEKTKEYTPENNLVQFTFWKRENLCILLNDNVTGSTLVYHKCDDDTKEQIERY